MDARNVILLKWHCGCTCEVHLHKPLVASIKSSLTMYDTSCIARIVSTYFYLVSRMTTCIILSMVLS